MPERATSLSAGYDFYVAQDITIPSYHALVEQMKKSVATNSTGITLNELNTITKTLKTKPTLVPTGIKAKLDDDKFLQLSVRSSAPLKSWIILANGVGIIDADYYDNKDNEGEIFFQVINLSPWPIALKKGDKIGQGVILTYAKIEDDAANKEREGGFGSTTEKEPVAASEDEEESRPKYYADWTTF